MSTGHLDIFIPYWGSEELLFEAVDSVRAQDDPRWRLTIIDDCYPSEIVAPYFDAIDDERIVYRRNERNVGITENFRRSVQGATASHVTVMGSDDRLLPNYVRVVLDAIAQSPTADVIQPGVRVIGLDGHLQSPLVDRVKQGLLAPRTQSGRVTLRAEEMATSLIRGNWLYWPSLALRTETARRVDFRDGLLVIQDLALLMDIAFDGGELVFDPTVAFEYRRHEGSASMSMLLDGRRFSQERGYFHLAADLAHAQGWRRTRRAARARWFSRAHAITEIPAVLRRGTPEGRRALLAHIFGS